MNVSFADLDYFISSSTQGPDNVIDILIIGSVAIAGVALLVAGIVGMFWRSKP